MNPTQKQIEELVEQQEAQERLLETLKNPSLAVPLMPPELTHEEKVEKAIKQLREAYLSWEVKGIASYEDCFITGVSYFLDQDDTIFQEAIEYIKNEQIKRSTGILARTTQRAKQAALKFYGRSGS